MFLWRGNDPKFAHEKSRPLFRLIISHIMESEIKKGLFRLLQIYLKYLGAYKMTQAVKKVSEIFG